MDNNNVINLLLFILSFSSVFAEEIERITVSEGQSFSFECQLDESVFFGKQMNQWSELQENDLNLRFQYLTDKNILRVVSDAVQSSQIGFYACRQPSWSSTSMRIIYQLLVADIQSFYWNFICHDVPGSCERRDDVTDINRSVFEVADGTNTELFCCASSAGYNKIDIRMNPVGDNLDNVQVTKNVNFDGALVVCAQQRTKFRRLSFQNQQTLLCELSTDDKPHSTLSSLIIIKDPIVPIRLPENPIWDSRPHIEYQRDVSQFDRRDGAQIKRKRRTLRRIGFIVGISLIVLLLLVIIFILLCLLFCRKTKSSNTTTTTTHSTLYAPVRTKEEPRYVNQRAAADDEHIYEEPTVLSETSPVFIRC